MFKKQNKTKTVDIREFVGDDAMGELIYRNDLETTAVSYQYHYDDVMSAMPNMTLNEFETYFDVPHLHWMVEEAPVSLPYGQYEDTVKAWEIYKGLQS